MHMEYTWKFSTPKYIHTSTHHLPQTFCLISCHEKKCYTVLKLLYNVNLEPSFYERRQIEIEMIKENLMNMQEENWLLSVSNKPKLRTYQVFKETLRVENMFCMICPSLKYLPRYNLDLAFCH